MKKLIELLNEYEIEREKKIDLFNNKEKPLWEWYKDCTGDLTFEPTDSKILNGEVFSGDTAHSVIISKSYGFIGWLVDNDKIDKDKLYNSEYKPYFWNKKTNAFSGFWAENILLMLLAISETPIDLLCSVLK